MLILTRKAGETVVIDGNIKVTIIAIRGGQVRIGVDAPADVAVDREEIHDKKQEGANEAS